MITPAQPTSSRLSPYTLIGLAYLGGWATGALVWLIEREHREVRFHGAQAMLLFGSLMLLWAALWVGSFLVLTVSATGFTVLQRLSFMTLGAAVVLWGGVLWMAWRRWSWRFPVVGRWADRLTRP